MNVDWDYLILLAYRTLVVLAVVTLVACVFGMLGAGPTP